MLGRSVNLTTLFLGRLRPPKQLTSTSCTYSNWQLPFLKKAEGETKVCCQTGYRSQNPWLTSQVPYRLCYAAGPSALSNRQRTDARLRVCAAMVLYRWATWENLVMGIGIYPLLPDPYFFSTPGRVVLELCPFFNCMNNLVSRISEKTATARVLIFGI